MAVKWSISASVLLGTKEDFIYRLLYERAICSPTAGEAIAALLVDTEQKTGRPVLGLWDLGVTQAPEE